MIAANEKQEASLPPLAMAYTRQDAVSLLTGVPACRGAVAMTPDALAALKDTHMPAITSTRHLDDKAHARIVARVRRLERACRKTLSDRSDIPETVRITVLSDLHYLCASVFALWFLLGPKGPWLVPDATGEWHQLASRHDALGALVAHLRRVGAPVRTWLRLPLAGRLVRPLNRFFARFSGRARCLATSGCSYGMGNLAETLVQRHSLSMLEIRGATGTWRDLAHPIRSCLQMLRGNAVATIIAAPEPEPALVRELEAWWPTIPDAVALTGLQTYRQDVVREAALTHAETAEMGRILEAAACRAVVLNTLHWGADVALAEAAGRRGIPRFLISHGTHAPGGTIAADTEQRALADGQLVSRLADTAICQSPHADALAARMLPDGARRSFRPTMWGYKDLPERAGETTTRRILHAGTYKKLIGFRPWIYETSNEYVDGLARLIRAVDKLGNAYLVIRFRPMAECSLGTLQQLLPLSDCYEIKSDGAFLDDLAEADLLVSYASTTIEEALDARRPVLLWGGSPRCRHLPAQTLPPTASARAAIYAADDDDALDELLGPILACHAGAPLSDTELAGHVWPAGTAGVAGVADLIAETALSP